MVNTRSRTYSVPETLAKVASSIGRTNKTKKRDARMPTPSLDESTQRIIAYEAIRTMSHDKTSICGGFNMIMDAALVKQVMLKTLPDVQDFNYYDMMYSYDRFSQGNEGFISEHSRAIDAMRVKAIEVWHWILLAYVSASKLVSSNTGTHTAGAYSNSVRLANMILKRFGPGECGPAAWATFETSFVSDSWKWDHIVMAKVERTSVWRDHHAEVEEFLGRIDFV
jgi:hypothetical protein